MCALSEEWEIIRQDDGGGAHSYRFQRGLNEENAKRIADERNNSGHHQKYHARPYEANDPDILY